jgi:hypothetical protein
MNYVFTKNITGITNQTLQAFFGAGSILAAAANNFIKKITFVCEPNSVLTAQSNVQNTSCFAEMGDNIKFAQNPVGATTNIYYDIEPNNAVGEFLDLRTALKFTATGTISVVLYF